VPKVFGQHASQVVLVDDQQPVEELAAQGADDPLADRVGPRRHLHLVQATGIDVSG